MHIVTGLPETVSVLGFLRPLEAGSSTFLGNIAELFNLFADAGLGSVKLEQKKRRFGERQLRICVHRSHLDGIQKFDPSDRQP